MSLSFPNSSSAPSTGQIEFRWIGQAWALFSARSGVWIIAVFLLFLTGAALWLLWAIPTGALSALRQMFAAISSGSPALMPRGNPVKDFALKHLAAVLTGGIEALFLGGLYRTALQQIRGETISALGLFSGFSRAVPLLAVGIVPPVILSILTGMGLWGMHLAHAPMASSSSLVSEIAVFPGLVIDALVMFAPLLVVDQNASAADALRGSVRLLRGQWFMGIAFYLVAVLLSAVGAFLCGVGMLVTYPVFILSIAAGYFALTQPPADDLPGFEAAPTPGVWPPPPQIR